MSQGMFFDTGGGREYHESESQQQEALLILRKRSLTKASFESDWPGGRLAPAIEQLRNGWGFEIAGDGSRKEPYRLLDPMQSPTRVRTTEELKGLYYESDHWISIREQRWQNDDHRCLICTSSCRDELVCHHIRYNLFGERLDELMTVCEFHHQVIHDNSKLKFPSGVDLPVAERLLRVPAYTFEEWLLP